MVNKKEFTLVELLIVIAIIGIVAALVITNLITSLQKGKQKTTMGDMKSIGSAIEYYALNTFSPFIISSNKQLEKILFSKNELEGLKMEITELKNFILENPEKAINILLLKKEMEKIQTQLTMLSKYTESEISDLRDSHSNIMAIITVFIAGIFVTFLANILKKSKKNDAREDSQRKE